MPSPADRKSTTVRFSRIPTAQQALRWGWKAMSAVAPGLAEDRAVDLFFTPRRHKVRVPRVEGHEARPFTVACEGDRLAAWSFGEGPAVLCAHGWAGDAAQLAPFVAPLVAAGRRAVLFDQPAHGASTGRQTNVLAMGRAVQAVADVVGPVEGVVAHSLGGTAAAIALSRGLGARRAAFVASPVEPHDFAWQIGDLLGLDERARARLLDRACARLGRTPDEMRIDDAVRGLEVPLLVVHDPADREVPVRHADRLQAAWPGTEVWRPEGLGHRKILRDSGVIARVVAHVTGAPPA